MSRTIYSLLILFIGFSYLTSQVLTGSEHHYMEYENDARFWEDPDGVIYDYDEIWSPDKTGIWTFFKVDDTGIREDIFIHNINCLPMLDGRRRINLSQEIVIYPNPAEGIINLKQPFDKGKIHIKNMKGQLLRSIVINSQETISINLSDFPSGMFSVHVLGQNSIISQLFVLQ